MLQWICLLYTSVPAGIAYALGICLQFLDHRFLKDKVTETAVFVIAAVGLLFFHERAVHLREDENMPAVEEEKLSMDSNGKKDSGREVYAQERIPVSYTHLLRAMNCSAHSKMWCGKPRGV